MLKRATWLTVGFGLGVGTTVATARRVRRRLDRYQPRALADRVATTAQTWRDQLAAGADGWLGGTFDIAGRRFPAVSLLLVGVIAVLALVGGWLWDRRAEAKEAPDQSEQRGVDEEQWNVCGVEVEVAGEEDERHVPPVGRLHQASRREGRCQQVRHGSSGWLDRRGPGDRSDRLHDHLVGGLGET